MLYHYIEKLLPNDCCVLGSSFMIRDRDQRDPDQQRLGDCQTPGSTVFYNPSYLTILLPVIKPSLERIWGKRLIPAYTYSRILYPGSILEPHTDRPSCEYSVTVTMGHNYPEDFWFPIYMGGTPINIPVGDAVTYKGCEVEHWRDPLIGEPDKFWIQSFFHYVDADGEYAEEHGWDMGVVKR
jgi:hypothetical protein